MDKLFAVAFTPEELGVVMSALSMSLSMMPEDPQIPWIIDSMKSAFAKCDAIRPEAIKHALPESVKSVDGFIEKLRRRKDS